MKNHAEASTSTTPSDKAKKKLLDALNNVQEEEKINFLVNRVLNVEADAQKVKAESSQLNQQKNLTTLLEKKLSSVEKMLSKTELSKSKLEQLCRELQTRNKSQEQAHQQAVEAFKKSLADIQKSVDARKEQTVPNVEKLSANLNQLATEYDTRLKDLKKLYEDREESIHSISKAKEEEIAILRSELDGMQGKIREVFEENVNLKRELLRCEEKIKLQMENELQLRKMVDSYSERYSSLANSITQSNEAFDKMKKEMTKMNGNLIKVETESRKKKTQLEEANKMVLALTAEKMDFEKTMSLKERQLAQLQELCRRLQKQQTPNGSVSEENHSSDEQTIATDNDAPQPVAAVSQ